MPAACRLKPLRRRRPAANCKRGPTPNHSHEVIEMTRLFKNLSLPQMSQTKNHVVAALVCGLALAAPMGANALGYVSRDCPQVGTKESITWDKGTPRWFYTESWQLRKDPNRSNALYWKKEVSGSGWGWTRDSRAGYWVFNYIQNYYWSGVQGRHWYYNTSYKRTEYRTSYVTNCDILNWGLNNW